MIFSCHRNIYHSHFVLLLAFLRVSMFLWFIGLIGMRLAWACFYDDYTMVSREDCASNGLTWDPLCQGRQESHFFWQSFLGLLEPSSASPASLKDPLLFTYRNSSEWAYNFECVGCQISQICDRLQTCSIYVPGVERNLVAAAWASAVQSAFWDFNKFFSTWICFTDGACEEKATVGAVLINPLGSAACAFGAELLFDLQTLFYKGSKHPIYEVELLPVLLSLLVWGSQLRQRQVVYYLDNDAAKAGLIKGWGATLLANVIVGNFCASESKLELKTWFSRVPTPTHSNLSDGPSRMDFSLVSALGCAIHQVPWHEVSGFMLPRLGWNAMLWQGVKGLTPLLCV